MLRANDASIQSASALLCGASDAYHRTLPLEASDSLDRRLQAVQRLVSRVSAGIIDVLVVGKPGVGTSSLISTLAAAISASHSSSVSPASPTHLPTEATVEAEMAGMRVVLASASDTTLDDPLVDERVLATFAVILVLDSEPYAHDVRRLVQLTAVVPDVPLFVFVNKLDVLQYMHGPDFPLVEGRIRDKVAPFVADARRDVMFGCARTADGQPTWTTPPVVRLVSAVLARADGDEPLTARLLRRIRSFVLMVREDAARLLVTQYAIGAAHRRLTRGSFARLAASIAMMMAVDDAAASTIVQNVHGRFDRTDPELWSWNAFADRLLCAVPFSTSGIRRRRYARLTRFGEAAIDASRVHVAATPQRR